MVKRYGYSRPDELGSQRFRSSGPRQNNSGRTGAEETTSRGKVVEKEQLREVIKEKEEDHVYVREIICDRRIPRVQIKEVPREVEVLGPAQEKIVYNDVVVELHGEVFREEVSEHLVKRVDVERTYSDQGVVQVPTKRYLPRLKTVDILVPVLVDSERLGKWDEATKKVTKEPLELGSSQYNSLLRQLNADLPDEHKCNLPWRT